MKDTGVFLCHWIIENSLLIEIYTLFILGNITRARFKLTAPTGFHAKGYLIYDFNFLLNSKMAAVLIYTVYILEKTFPKELFILLKLTQVFKCTF